MEKISAIIINYNGLDTITHTIESLYDSTGVDMEVLVVDDCSNDGSPEIIKEQFPKLSLFIQPENTGKLNLLRNKGLKQANTDKVLIIDNDNIFEKNCLKNLLEVMENDELVTVCTPRLMYLDEPERLYTEADFISWEPVLLLNEI